MDQQESAFQCDNKVDSQNEQSLSTEPERRFVNGRWLCRNSDNTFLEYVNNEWRAVGEDNLESLWDNAAASTSSFGTARATGVTSHRCVVNGIQMTWNSISQQWIPDVEVDEDFLANYHANYGVAYDYSQMPARTTATTNATTTEKERPLTKEERRAKKREQEQRESAGGWVDIDEDRNTNVYVSRLPTDITEEEFIEFMSKCGVIMKDPRNNKPKIKLYRAEDGELKGDATCCYVKKESVEMALNILDGWDLRGRRVSVEKAHFELKGDFDPSKKKRRLTAAQKKRFFESQQKIFEWKPEKPRNYRPISNCTVVLKNMFTLDEIDNDTSRIFDLKTEMETVCERFGNVKKVVVYDTNPEGVVAVTFENVEASDQAIQILDGTSVSGRVVSAALWDGRTKYRREETEEERNRRDAAWQKYLGVEKDDVHEHRPEESDDKLDSDKNSIII